MLKGIPGIISPDLMRVLMEMGHGDEIVIADSNFPAASNAQRLVHCDGHNVPPLLNAVLQFLPLDNFVKQPVALMAVVIGDQYSPDIWPVYKDIILQHQPDFLDFEMLDRFEFYERAKKAYAIVTTGEMSRYANIILKKGII